MSTTNDTFVNIVNKKILGTIDFSTRIFDYMKSYNEKTGSSMFDLAAIYGADLINITTGGTDRIAVEGSGSELDGEAIDGLGHFLKPSDILAADRVAYFENEISIDYDISVSYCELPVDVVINPRTGYPDYTAWKEYVGLRAEPTSVVDNGDNTITFAIPAGVLETGVDNKNRELKVFLKVPDQGGTTIDLAMEQCISTYSGGVNYITTIGTLGQSVISETASDYYVCLLGPCVWRNFDPASVTTTHVPLGFVTGVGAGSAPTVFDNTKQTDRNVDQSLYSIFALGLERDFLPLDDVTYNLGSASKKWAAIYVQDLEIDGDLIPSGSTNDIGDVGTQWRDLYIDGTAFIDIIELSDTDDEGFNTNVIPTTDDTYDLGKATRKWKDIYIDGIAYVDTLNLSAVAGEGVGTDCNPITTNTKDLGSTGRKWKDLYVDGIAYLDNITILAGDIVTDTTTGLRIGTGATQKLGFFGETPVARDATQYNLSFATADKTHDARTAATLTDNSGGASSDGTIGAISTGGNVGADIPDAITELADMVNKLIADQQDTGAVVNSLVLELFGLGLVDYNV